MKNIRERKARWQRFLSGETGERLLVVIEPEWINKECPYSLPYEDERRRSWILKKYETLLSLAENVDDDSIPYIDTGTGTEIFAESLGCHVYRHGSDMPMGMPFVMTTSDAAKVSVPDVGACRLASILEWARGLKRQVGDQAIPRLVDLQTPIDVCAIMWEKTMFYPAMIEEPEAVTELARKVASLQFAFLDQWFRLLGDGFISHYPSYFMQKGVTVSADEVGAINPDMFDTFFLPDLNAFSDRYGSIGIHCCAEARHQWGGFAKVKNLKVLNLSGSTQLMLDSLSFFGGRMGHFPQSGGWTMERTSAGPDGSAVRNRWIGSGWQDLVHGLPSDARMILGLDARDMDHAKALVEEVRAIAPTT